MNYPGAIIFVNNDLTDQVKGVMSSQLFLTEIITIDDFSNRLSQDPDYISLVHNLNLRLLVIYSEPNADLQSLADVVLFVKTGLASILYNKLGPPGQTYPVATLHLYQLIPTSP